MPLGYSALNKDALPESIEITKEEFVQLFDMLELVAYHKPEEIVEMVISQLTSWQNIQKMAFRYGAVSEVESFYGD